MISLRRPPTFMPGTPSIQPGITLVQSPELWALASRMTQRGEPRGRLEYSTDYLIVGGMPVMNQREAREQQAPAAIAGSLSVNADKLQQEALSKGVEIFRVVNGKLAERWIYIDMVPAMKELGTFPAAPH